VARSARRCRGLVGEKEDSIDSSPAVTSTAVLNIEIVLISPSSPRLVRSRRAAAMLPVELERSRSLTPLRSRIRADLLKQGRQRRVGGECGPVTEPPE